MLLVVSCPAAFPKVFLVVLAAAQGLRAAGHEKCSWTGRAQDGVVRGVGGRNGTTTHICV